MNNISKKRKYSLIAIGLALFCLLLFAAFFNGLTTTNYTIETNKLSQSIRVVLLADLHSCIHGKNQETLISMIDKQKPDIILMAGDIADDEMPHDGTIELLEGISNRYPCYYVTGNHELWSSDVDAIRDIFRKHNVSILEGACSVVEIGGQLINICGVDDPAIGESVFEKQLDSAFSSIDDALYTILLSHRPERFEQESKYPCDLILSGHAHSGQWRIPFLVHGVFAPDQGFFPEYTSGIHTINGVKMLVSRGLSRESTRIPRVFNPPEVVVIDLVPQ